MIEADSPLSEESKMIEFDIQDMTCRKCERLIQDAVYTVDTSAEVDVDLENKRVSIMSEAKADLFENELKKQGYTPVLI